MEANVMRGHVVALILAVGLGLVFGEVPGQAATLELLPALTLQSPNEQEDGVFGHAVAGAGDVDGDGVPDLLVGALWESPGPSPDRAGRAYVFAGTDGSLLLTLQSPTEEASGRFGSAVAGVGDLDGDGISDQLVGAPGEAPDASPDRAGRAHVLRGADGTLLRTLASPFEEGDGHFGAADIPPSSRPRTH